MRFKTEEVRIKEKLTCWRCGKEVIVDTTKRTVRAYCSDCKDKKAKEIEKLTNDYLVLRSKVMFENAMKCLEKQNIDMDYYREACDVIKELVDSKPSMFDSMNEITACIQLINDEVEIKPQYKIKNYRVDILLPTLKVALELDGQSHIGANKVLYDAKRDIDIINELGNGWEVIRVKNSFIEKKISCLLEAIKAEYKQRKLYREHYNGILPDNYSDYTKALYRDILGISKKNKNYKTQSEIDLEEKHKKFNEFIKEK